MCARFHALTPYQSTVLFSPSPLSVYIYILLCNSGIRENNEKNPRPPQTPSSLKTAHSGVKFEILISKKSNSARTAYNRLFFLFASAFSLSCPFSFAPSLAMFAGVAMRVGRSKASNVSINAAARSQTLAFDRVFCLRFDSTLQLYAHKKFQLLINIFVSKDPSFSVLRHSETFELAFK